MFKRILLAFCAVSLATTTTAQTIGSYLIWPEYSLGTTISVGGFPTFTFVNLTAPATADATIRMVAVRTTSPGLNPCTDAVKIKFFHRSGNRIVLFADTGPLAVTGIVTKVILPSPVNVLAGDVIGVAMPKPCVQAVAQTMKTEGTAMISGDASGAYDLYGIDSLPSTVQRARLMPAIALGVFGSSNTDTEIRSQVVVAAASATGVGGSKFKTDIQLGNQQPQLPFNPVRGGTVAGRLVYHPEGTSGTPSDPSVSFKLLANETRTLLDFVGGLGLSGKGSIDVYTTVGFEAPFAVARVYEDSGGSTKGFTMDAQLPERALQDDAILFTPTDPAKFRMNIGVRTLDRATTLGFTIYSANGTRRAPSVDRSYPANYYIQTEASQLLGMPLQAGDTIVVSWAGAPVFVYGSIIDNTSQDPSVQFASVPK